MPFHCGPRPCRERWPISPPPSTFQPDVDFIIDIGGQDMKCFKIQKRHHRLDLPERGLLLWLRQLCRPSPRRWATMSKNLPRSACCRQAGGPRQPLHRLYELLRQAGAEGRCLDRNISAGLSISVVKNALYKGHPRFQPRGTGPPHRRAGRHTTEQAVLRAFEKGNGRPCHSPPTSRA